LKKIFQKFQNFLSEFSPSAEWIDPGSKLILPDVVCHLCGVTKDVDLGIRINPECDCSEKEIKSNLKNNLNQIERRLIDLIRRKLIGWNIQDVTCIRCNEVRVRDMSNLCECSGKFKVMEDGKSLQTLIRTVRSIAEFYSMNTLKSTMDWILGSTGTKFKTILHQNMHFMNFRSFIFVNCYELVKGVRKSPAIKIDKKIIL